MLRHELNRVPPAERELISRGDGAAEQRVLRALFWTLVYQLEPERWHELAQSEPIHPALLDLLPTRAKLSVDVGAGSGRLTRHLVQRSDRVIAIEPSLGLGSLLTRRLPSVGVVSAWAETLPLPDSCAQLTAACGAFGPNPEIIAELQRVTAPGGCIALINPEEPAWFQSQGWSRISVEPPPALPHAAWIDDFFGPPDPPRELVMLQV